MLRNQVTSLLRHGRIKTTTARAKEVRGLAEKMITLGKDGSVPARRRALAFVLDPDVVGKVFAELAPRYAARAGGYTRITRIGARKGDGAAMAQLELID
ncbi:MAG: 50S ribosomal protein L17 [Dehalococcoidia bacterium]|nr:50S ribosomal protein L17 [Dehalococcoidia bacterium]